MKKPLWIAVLVSVLLVGVMPVSANSTGAGTPTGVGQAPPLSETFEAFGLSVNYPAGWTAQEYYNLGIDIFNRERLFDLLDASRTDPIALDAFALLVVSPEIIQVGASMPLETAMERIPRMIISDFESGAMNELTVNGQRALRLAIQPTVNELEGIMVGYMLDDELIVVVAVAHTGKMAKYEDVAAAMIESITLTATGDPAAAEPADADAPGAAQALPETFTAFGLSVDYPAGWAAREQDSVIEIVNDPDLFVLIDNDKDDVAPPGAFALRILDPTGLTMLLDEPIESIMEGLVVSMTTSDWTVGELTEMTVGDYPAMRLSINRLDTLTDGALISYRVDDQTLVIVLITARTGELADFEATAAAIMASITLAN